MFDTDGLEDYFEVRINKDNKLINFVIPALTHDEAKREALAEGKGSIVHIRSMTGKTPVPVSLNGRTAEIFQIAELRQRRRMA